MSVKYLKYNPNNAIRTNELQEERTHMYANKARR